jgi:hypothetical protein
MGLDMYLSIRKVGNDESKPVEIGYWRKANAIHRYMVGEEAYRSGEDNCKEFIIPAGDMMHLGAICKRILDFAEEKEENPDAWRGGKEGPYTNWEDYADFWLPTAEGFFFGDTDYDESYLQDLRDTLDKQKAALL